MTWRQTQQTLVLMKTSSRCLDQDEYIRLSHTYSEDVFRTSSRRLDQDQYIRLGHASSRRLQEVLQKRLQDIFKTSCKDVLKTFSRRFIKLNCFFLICFRDVFSTFLRRTTDGYLQKVCLGHTFEKFMVSVQNLLEW